MTNNNTEKKMYLGSSIDNIEKTKVVMHAINRAHWKITHDWTMHGNGIEIDYLKAAYAVAMVKGVLAADVVGVLLPGGRGVHVELGVAIGNDKPVIILADNFELLKSGNSGQPSTFYSHPLVHIVKTLEEFLSVADLLL